MWSFATGDPEAIERFASRFGVSVMRDDPAAPEIVTHNLRTAVIDPKGRLDDGLRRQRMDAAELLDG